MYGKLITCLCKSPIAFSMLALICTKQFCGFRFIRSGPMDLDSDPGFDYQKFNITISYQYLQYILLHLRFQSFRKTSSSIKHYFLWAVLPCWFRISSGFRNRILRLPKPDSPASETGFKDLSGLTLLCKRSSTHMSTKCKFITVCHRVRRAEKYIGKLLDF